MQSHVRKAIAPLALPQDMVGVGLRGYRDSGLEVCLPYKEAGVPAGQPTRPAAVVAQLQRRLAPPTGLASSLASQR